MSDADRHQRVRQAFHRIMSADVSARGDLIDDVMSSEPDLRAELESLLSHAEDGASLESAASDWRRMMPFLVDAGTSTPTRLGRYRLVRHLGSGSMGAVFLAERDHPRRTVAVKVLHRAFASSRHRRRFEMESEILGRLDHPGIAGVLDAGCEADHPFFVMEYVDGVPLTTYAASHDLSVRDRVGLLVSLCDAIAHAHQRGVVHRDLKPANIFVDATGRLRVLDFGVARALDGDAGAPRHTMTGAGELLGTIPYMSPEQLDGDPDIDVRTDVYAIGALMFELLSGERPHDLSGLSLPEAIQTARTSPARRLLDVSSTVPRDLSIIAGRALSPSRHDRYQNVVELAADLRRWLHHEPILARPPSAFYQVVKFAERHRAITLATTGGMLVLFVATLGTSAALLEAKAQRRAADQATRESDRQRDEALRLGDRVRRQRDAFLSVVALAELPPERLESLASSLAGAADSIDAILAYAFAARGRFVEARTHALRAIEDLEDPAGRDLEAAHELLWLSIRIDLTASYSDRRVRWLAANDALIRRSDPTLSALLAELEQQRPDLWTRDVDADAIRETMRRIRAHVDTLPDDRLDVQLAADRLTWLAEVHASREAFDEAIEMVEASMAFRRRHLLETSPRILRGTIVRLGILLGAGRLDEVEHEAAQAIDALDAILPEDHLALGLIRSILGRALVRDGRAEEAHGTLVQAIPVLEAGMSPHASELVEALDDLGRAANLVGDEDGRAEAARRAISASAHEGQRKHWHRVRFRVEGVDPELARAADRAFSTRDPTTFEARFEELFERWEAVDMQDPDLSLVLANAARGWVDVWIDSGGWSLVTADLIEWAREVAERHGAAPIVRADLAALTIPHRARQGDFDGAARAFREGLRLVDEASGDLEWARPYLHLWHGRSLLEQGRVDEGARHLELAREGLVLRYGVEGYNTQFAFEALSLVEHARRSPKDARRFDAEELALVRADVGSGPRRHGASAWCVARVPGHSRTTYEAALDSARFADEALSGTWLVRRSRALAAYRCGEYHEAIDAVRRLHETTRGERPGLRAIEALAMAAISDPEAIEVHRRAVALGSMPEFAHDMVTRSLLDEARLVFEARGSDAP